MAGIDEKDERIIEALRENSRLSYRQISKKTGIPPTTIYKHIKELRKEGVIRRFTVEVDNAKMGKPLGAIILVSCDFRLLREQKKDQHVLADGIRKLPKVESVEVVTGATDLVVRVRLKNMEEFDEFLLRKFQVIPGIDRTQSLVVIYQA